MDRLRICWINAIAPPASGSRGERSAFFVRELARRGHRITVVQAELPAGFPQVDRELESVMTAHPVERLLLDGGTASRLKFNASRSIFRRAVSELAWPDYWAGFASKAIAALARRGRDFDVVLTSGQPWSDHLVGYEMSRRHGIPWVADYGDPWGLTLRDGRWRPNASFAAERRMLRLAAATVVTTPATARTFRARYGLSPETVSVLPAGIELEPPEPPPHEEILNLAHAGTVYGPRASIAPFVAAFESFRNSTPAILHWFGELRRPGDRGAVERIAEGYRSRVPYAVVRQAEARSHAIVIFGNHGGLQLPGKIWRALGSGRMVFAVAADVHDALHDLEPLEGLRVVENRRESIVAALEQVAEAARTREYTVETDVARRLSWPARTDALESILRDSIRRRTPTATPPSATRLIARHTLSGTQLRFRARRLIEARRADPSPCAPPDAESALERSWTRCVQSDWTGWDPYDGLMARRFPFTLLNKSRWTRLALIQGVLRSPVNLRPLLGVPQLQNPKALALGLESACRLSRVEQGLHLVESILAASAPTRSGLGWGYPFDWQARSFRIERDVPTVVCTGFVVRALDTARRVEQLSSEVRRRVEQAIVGAAGFVRSDLNRTSDKDGLCFSYSPRDRSQVVNATLLGAETLARAATIEGNFHDRDTIASTVNWALARQTSSGGWAYGDANHHRWEDGFHTGFNILSLLAIRDAWAAGGVDPEQIAPVEPIRRAASHYAEHFFDDDGRPSYYRHTPWPIDAHAAAVAVLTLLACRELVPDRSRLAERVLDWALRNLMEPGGHFAFRQYRRYRIRTPFLRWSEAWMLRALAEWHVRGASDRRDASTALDRVAMQNERWSSGTVSTSCAVP